MLPVILIFAISLTLPLLSIWILHQEEARSRTRFRAVMEATARSHLLSLEAQRLEISNPLIGDASCQYNARSALIRCAVNPSGPCQECPYYEPF